MGSTSIFTNSDNLYVTLISLLVLLVACLFTDKGTRIRRGIWFLYLGLFVDFLAVWVEYESLIIFKHGGSITFMVYLELFLFLVVMILLAISASQILINSVPDIPVVTAVAGLSFLCIIYYIYIEPDGNMVFNMRNLFPMAGFAYLTVSFWSQIRQKHPSGYIMAGAVTTMITIFLFLKFINNAEVNKYLPVTEMWYFPAFAYLTLTFAIVLIRVNSLSDKLDTASVEIEKNNQRLQDIVKSSPFPIIISKLGDDKIIMANNNAVKLFGILPQEVDRYRLKDFFVDVENRRLLTERLEREREVQDFEILVKTPSGDTPFWLLASANIIDYNNDVALYSAFQDITSRKNRELLLKNQAIRDPLTSLYNRRYFEDEAFNRIVAAKANETDYSVLMIDADHFKRVNDTYGHKTGDKVLIELAATAEKALREDDIVARYGGEEFVIFLDKVNASKAHMVAERLRESIASIVVYSDEGDEVRFTVSIGISSSEVSDNVGMLIKTADEALYRAKQTGRNRVEIFSKSDLQTFAAQEKAERKSENVNHHPIFDKEDNQEISLLDGIPSNQIQEDDVEIEESTMALPGVDREDLGTEK